MTMFQTTGASLLDSGCGSTGAGYRSLRRPVAAGRWLENAGLRAVASLFRTSESSEPAPSLQSGRDTLLVIARQHSPPQAVTVAGLQTSHLRGNGIHEHEQHIAAHPAALVPQRVPSCHEISAALGSHIDDIQARSVCPVLERFAIRIVQFVDIQAAGAGAAREGSEQGQDTVVTIRLQSRAQRQIGIVLELADEVLDLDIGRSVVHLAEAQPIAKLVALHALGRRAE